MNMLKEYQERTSTSATVAEQPLVTPNCVIQDLDLNSSEREVSEDMTDSVMVLKKFRCTMPCLLSSIHIV